MDLNTLFWNLALLALVGAGLATIIGWKTAQSKLLTLAARIVGLSLAITCGAPFIVALVREIISEIPGQAPVSVTTVSVPAVSIEVPTVPAWLWVVVGLGHVGLLVLILRRRRAAQEERRRAWVEFEQARNRGRTTLFPTDFGGP